MCVFKGENRSKRQGLRIDTKFRVSEVQGRTTAHPSAKG